MKKTLLLLLLGLLLLGGCAVNPVTGERELSFISEAQELSIGKQQYAPLRQAQGGDYVVDPEVQAYVSQVGERLAAVSDRKLPYEFKVLNNSVPNAWALPGGKIAINRGLLTELKSEAELAAVLGHEIVHAAAKHSAKGIQRGMLLQGVLVAASIATQGEQYANLAVMGASVGAQLITQKYGRDAERESDLYGMKYMSRAGYDPQGAVELQETFVKLSEGRREDWLSGLFASHPPSRERVQNNIKTVATLPKGGEVGRERYQRKLARLIRTKAAYKAYDEAQKALSDGDVGKATGLMQKAIDIEPSDGHFFSLLGDIDQRNKRFQAARRNYDKAIRLNNDFFYYHLQRGLVNEKLKDNTPAKLDLERSVELLPTADAFNALGNIARAEGRHAEAKQYYAKAASNDSSTGKAAYGSLVELDLPENPGNYIKVRTGLSPSGTLLAQISNPTPKNVKGLVLVLQYPDAVGRLRQIRRSIGGRLKAGQKRVVDLGIAVTSPQQASQIRGRIVAARIVP